MTDQGPNRTNRILAWLVAALGLGVLLTALVVGYLAVRGGASARPRGQLVLVAGNLTEGLDLYLADARGGSRQRLTDQPGDELFPVWSPDGRTLAYARVALVGRAGAGFVPGLYLLDLSDADRPRESLLYESAADNLPLAAWSPDGQRLAIPSIPSEVMDTEATTTELTIADVGTRALERHVLPLRVTAPSLSWSSDGSRLALIGELAAAPAGADTQGVYVFSPAQASLVSRIAGTATEAVWSPTEMLLACANLDGREGVTLLEADGAIVRTLQEEYHVLGVAWSPDGKRIAYNRMGPRMSELVVRDVESGDELFVIETRPADWSVAWSQDGAWLAHTTVSDAEDAYAVGVIDSRTGKLLDFEASEPLELMPAWRPNVH